MEIMVSSGNLSHAVSKNKSNMSVFRFDCVVADEHKLRLTLFSSKFENL